MATIEQQLEAITNGVAIAEGTDRAFLRITGPDATRWLNGMVTNSIQDLQPGEGNYNFFLNAQGRIQGDGMIFREPGEGEPKFVLQSTPEQLDTIEPLLERFIIMDDVVLKRMDWYRQGLFLLGPHAADILRKIEIPTFANKQSFADLAPAHIGYYEITAAQVTTRRNEFYIAAGTGYLQRATQDAIAHGAVEVSAESLEAHRILTGVPKFGADIRDKDLPQETNQSHALHFNKGCYLGQEIVERIRSRGQVHRVFTPLTLSGTLPELPAPLEANAKPAGDITSAVQVGDTIFALGYVRREFLETNALLTYSGGTAAKR